MHERIALRALAFGAAAQYLAYGSGAGINVLLATAAFLAATVAARPAPWPLAGLAVAFAALCAIRTEPALVAFDAAAAALLALAATGVAAGTALARSPASAIVREASVVARSTALGAVRVLGGAWGPFRAAAAGRLARGRGYGIGIAAGLPVVVIFSLLFASADAVYARVVGDALDLARWRERLGEAPARAGLAAAAAWACAGAAARASAAPTRPGPPVPGRLREDAAVGALAAVAAVFALFVAIQLAYLFGGRDTVEAARVPYSAYARRGFFELVAVVALLGPLLFAVDLALRRRRAYVAVGVALVGLAVVVLASAWYRLDLYQRAYGWTELRLYAAAGIALLAGVLAALLLAILRARMRHVVQPIVLGALATAVALNAIGPAAYVARMNLQRATDPAGLPADAERTLDVAYLASLGDAAVPVIVEALPRLAERERYELSWRLLDAAWRDAQRARPWQEWNLDRERARDVRARLRADLGAR